MSGTEMRAKSSAIGSHQRAMRPRPPVLEGSIYYYVSRTRQPFSDLQNVSMQGTRALDPWSVRADKFRGIHRLL